MLTFFLFPTYEPSIEFVAAGAEMFGRRRSPACAGTPIDAEAIERMEFFPQN
jgi:hypothetical protein